MQFTFEIESVDTVKLTCPFFHSGVTVLGFCISFLARLGRKEATMLKRTRLAECATPDATRRCSGVILSGMLVENPSLKWDSILSYVGLHAE